jgi:hypothetical protein
MNSDPSPKRRMSEMISEMAGNFIGMGKSAEGYRRFNPATSPDDLAKIRKDIEGLIERKLQMFPDDQRQIVSAKVVVVGMDPRIGHVVVTTSIQGW